MITITKFDENDKMIEQFIFADLSPDPLPQIGRLAIPDELSEAGAAALSGSEEPEYAIIEVATEFGDESAFVVENAPGLHETLAACPMGYGLRRWIRDAGFNIINAHSLLFTEDIPAEDAAHDVDADLRPCAICGLATFAVGGAAVICHECEEAAAERVRLADRHGILREPL